MRHCVCELNGRKRGGCGHCYMYNIGMGEARVEALVRAGTQKSPSAAQLDAER